ncbi:hypothetical protein AVEN_80151-1 [Araneus ventricosus]|uniref:Uncharacterized protein n=1 Tax=Araneus ventricosus TaxID=182803 RepID=A0A4Y2LN88_ARAVE|nr:hypothetical protein AVEN_80151-1 [Araneus ventricosus]
MNRLHLLAKGVVCSKGNQKLPSVCILLLSLLPTVADFDNMRPQTQNCFEAPSTTQCLKFSTGVALQFTLEYISWRLPRFRSEASAFNACAENRNHNECTNMARSPTEDNTKSLFSKNELYLRYSTKTG